MHGIACCSIVHLACHSVVVPCMAWHGIAYYSAAAMACMQPGSDLIEENIEAVYLITETVGGFLQWCQPSHRLVICSLRGGSLDVRVTVRGWVDGTVHGTVRVQVRGWVCAL